MSGVRVRTARADDPEDRAFLSTTAARLETGMPPRIPVGALAAAVERSVLDAVQARLTGEVILLAEDGTGRRLGFIYAATSQDGLSNEPQGHVSELAVAADAEGQGVARALLDAAEQWSRNHGLKSMIIRVFFGNTHARAVYEHLGYEPEVLQLRKVL